jgi:hypothetical protein
VATARQALTYKVLGWAVVATALFEFLDDLVKGLL